MRTSLRLLLTRRRPEAAFLLEHKEKKMDDMTKQVVAGMFRHLIGFAAGAMGLEWFLNPDLVNGLVTIGLGGFAVVWSWLNKAGKTV